MYIVETYLQDQIKELHFPIKKKKSVKVFMNLLDCIRKKNWQHFNHRVHSTVLQYNRLYLSHQILKVLYSLFHLKALSMFCHTT